MTPETNPEPARARRFFTRPLFLLLASLITLILVKVIGAAAIIIGLATPHYSISGPGEQVISSPPGTYIWAHPEDPSDPDRPRPSFTTDDPHATISPAARNEWMEIDSERFAVLGRLEITETVNTNVTIDGPPEAFPVMLYRDQMSWMTKVGMFVGIGAIVPITLLIAGVVVLLRDKHRETQSVLANMDTLD